ncbi:MAG TPA: tail fiber domain-containing protein, partial [Pyrinomonadaceae bacterium]|nr:tail fiber domain-containing protein [Pyrinomonadaceae bacterium]
LDLIKRLRPISYEWKEGGGADVGFGAEDVAKINQLFTVFGKDGQVEGVKYDRFSVLFVNAFKEQQLQIEAQARQINELKQIICALKPDAGVCNK